MITKYEQSNINMIIKRKKGSYVTSLPGKQKNIVALTKFCDHRKGFALLENVNFISHNFQPAKIMTVI